MNPATSKKMVLVSVALLSVLASVRKAQGGDNSLYKQLWGVGVIGVILSITADFAPTIAGPFAALTLLGSLTHGGDKVIGNVLQSVSDKLPAPRGGNDFRTANLGGGAPGHVPAPPPPPSAPGFSGSPQHTP